MEHMRVTPTTRIMKLDRRDVPEEFARPERGRMIRLYPTQHAQRWALQIRGPLGIGFNANKDGKDFVVANAPLDREDMKALREWINYELFPDGSGTAESTEKADGDQVAGRINSVLDYMINAAGKGDMRNVYAWATEIRALVDSLNTNTMPVPEPAECLARIPGTQNVCTRYVGHPGEHRCSAGDVDRGLVGQIDDDREHR